MTKGSAGLWTWDKIIALCKTHKISAPEAATIINAHISDLFKGNSLINFIIAFLSFGFTETPQLFFVTNLSISDPLSEIAIIAAPADNK